MVYNVIGMMSGSSLDGMDLIFTTLEERGGKWNYQIVQAACIPYEKELQDKLRLAEGLPAGEYQVLHTSYGRYIGEKVNAFIEAHHLEHQVALVASHGHTTFHLPALRTTHQMGDGAAIAAVTGLAVVSDLRSLDVAFGGQGAPIVPMGEKLLFPDFNYFLNIGGIANISIRKGDQMIAFDVCPANRVLNLLVSERGLPYDDGGKISAEGHINQALLDQLNALEYYHQIGPRSLPNSFGVQTIYGLLQFSGVSLEDQLRTMTEHICIQVSRALQSYQSSASQQLFVSGGGAFNSFLVQTLNAHLSPLNFESYLPDDTLISYKEALIMALLGTLRFREQNTVMASVTGAIRDSIGGALWLGTQA